MNSVIIVKFVTNVARRMTLAKSGIEFDISWIEFANLDATFSFGMIFGMVVYLLWCRVFRPPKILYILGISIIFDPCYPKTKSTMS